MEKVGASGGCAYLIDLDSGGFLPFVLLGERDGFEPRVVEGVANPVGRVGLLAEFQGREADTEGIAVYVPRGSVCIGVIALTGVAVTDIGDEDRGALSGLAALLGRVYQDDRLFALLQANDAIRELSGNGADDEDAFFEEAGHVLAAFVGTERVALHEVARVGRDLRLRCVFLSGYDGFDDRNRFDVTADDFPPYAMAAGGESTVIADAQTSKWDPTPRWVDPPTRSLVVLPIRAGEVLGVLTLGARCPFDHTHLELRGLESVADSLGFALSYRRNLEAAADRDAEDMAAAQAISALETSREARHGAKGHIDNCIKASSLLWKKTNRMGIDVEPELDAISNSLMKARGALDRQRALETWAERPVRCALQDVWVEACEAFSARLRAEHVEARFAGPEVEVVVSVEWLRLVFQNLILNSVEAFREGRRSGRMIELTVESTSERDRDIRMTYRDNGPGVNRGHLRSVAPADADLSKLVFERGVTSKPEGLGLGMWLTRKALKQHGGSIDLLRSRNGVRFAIRLPNPDNERLSHDHRRLESRN
jgi:signal transduction histidine kinase